MFEVIVGLALLPAAICTVIWLISIPFGLMAWIGNGLLLCGHKIYKAFDVLFGPWMIGTIAGAVGIWLIAQSGDGAIFSGYCILAALVIWFGFRERAL